eukprot:1326409-Amorphochlora_amoeboformis.AAC.1
MNIYIYIYIYPNPNPQGLGFSFLRIPRSYYGRLALSDLISACQEKNFTASEPEELAKFVLKSLEAKVLSNLTIPELSYADAERNHRSS